MNGIRLHAEDAHKQKSIASALRHCAFEDVSDYDAHACVRALDGMPDSMPERRWFGHTILFSACGPKHVD